MGAYLSPPAPATKESWLVEHGTPSPDPSWVDRPEGTFPVCLIIKGIFVTASIAHNAQEFKYLRRPDGKPRYWFYVNIDDMMPVSNLKDHLPKDDIFSDDK